MMVRSKRPLWTCSSNSRPRFSQARLPIPYDSRIGRLYFGEKPSPVVFPLVRNSRRPSRSIPCPHSSYSMWDPESAILISTLVASPHIHELTTSSTKNCVASEYCRPRVLMILLCVETRRSSSTMECTDLAECAGRLVANGLVFVVWKVGRIMD